MHVIFGDVTLQYLNIQGFADLPYQITDPNGHVSKEERFVGFRYLHYVSLNRILNENLCDNVR